MTNAFKTVPIFFTGSKGRLFIVEYQPTTPPRGYAVYLPPLGEEMNRCRALMAAQCRTMARQGIHCQLVDYYGTGDSDGEFVEGNWELWLQDVEMLVRSNTAAGVPVWLVGLRFGGMIALELLRRIDIAIARVVLVQPITSGNKFVTQMLRQRAAFLMSNELPPETPAQMRESFASGTAVEVSGYSYQGALLAAMDEWEISGTTALPPVTINWLEQIPDAERSIPPGTQKAMDHLKAIASNISFSTFVDQPIWQLHEREDAPNCLSAFKEIVGLV